MKLSIFDQAGYFFNDDRASEGQLSEDDILGCGHFACGGRMMKRSKWKEHGGRCLVCDSFLCSLCYERVKTFGCEVFEREMRRAVENNYRKEQNAKILGI